MVVVNESLFSCVSLRVWDCYCEKKLYICEEFESYHSIREHFITGYGYSLFTIGKCVLCRLESQVFECVVYVNVRIAYV